MSGGSHDPLSRQLGAILECGTSTGLSDRELMERLLGPADRAAEFAFEALVDRHGPMVLRACRNILHSPDDVEDAFQATFLVLLRQRGTIRRLDSVGSWLFGVANRVAARARVDAAKRRRHEAFRFRLVSHVGEPESSRTDSTDHEALGPIVQEEVRRLPEKYRSVVLLCYWEGLTHEQAALRLGCPIGTVRSRIARARDRLRNRLVRRGLTSSTAVIAGLADGSPASAAMIPVPPALLGVLVTRAMQVLSGRTVAGVASGSIPRLVQEHLWSLSMMKVTKLGSALLFLGCLTVGLVQGAQRPKDRSAESIPDRGRTAARAQSIPPVGLHDYVVEPPDLLIVEALEALPGRPISGERLVRPDGKISLGFYGEIYVAGLTLPEIKEKIVLHLGKHLNDDVLGLVEYDPEDPVGKRILRRIPARESDRVFVDVTAYNSKWIYVQGEFAEPGQFHWTGSQTVLDVINYAGGLLKSADHDRVTLYKPDGAGRNQVKALRIDVDEIMLGSDPSTNLLLEPGDRLVALPLKKPGGDRAAEMGRTGPREGTTGSNPPEEAYPAGVSSPSRTGQPTPTVAGPAATNLRGLERRLDVIESKLEKILGKLDGQGQGSPSKPARLAPYFERGR